jgi:hypothetical protein
MKSKTMKRVEHVERMGEERKLYSILAEIPKKIDYSKDRGVDGRMGLEWIFSRLAWDVEWFELAQDRGRWRAHVNTATNVRVLAHGVRNNKMKFFAKIYILHRTIHFKIHMPDINLCKIIKMPNY